jgi:hypothetical protein
MLMLFLVLFGAPGSALGFVIYKLIKTRDLVTIARTDAARSGARLEAAREASEVAQGTAREAMSQTGQALEIARTIELVDEKVTSLTDYLVTQIEGEAPARRGTGRHALPGGGDLPAITGGGQEGASS